MDPIDEFAQLRAEILRLEERASALRADLLRPGARRRSNLYEVVVKDQVRRSFQTELLPPELLRSPRFWKEQRCQVVQLRELTDDAPVLLERFGTSMDMGAARP